jgi:hypothetical protein
VFGSCRLDDGHTIRINCNLRNVSLSGWGHSSGHQPVDSSFVRSSASLRLGHRRRLDDIRLHSRIRRLDSFGGTAATTLFNYYLMSLTSNRFTTPISVVEIVRSVRPFELFSLPDSPELHLCIRISPAQTLLLYWNVGRRELFRHFGDLLPVGVCRFCHRGNAVHQFGSTSFRKQIQGSTK